ncbi:MAG: phosphoenolpyruvate--protein phosphotransferase, partial [Desulfuromonas thiophila]|nr:phosphoenolpyruvate--protein phosphotransferase [Desulfuromonas thiophila]
GLSVCGEMAGEPMFSIVLLALGYRELSMNSSGISRVKKMVRQWNSHSNSVLRETLLRQKTAADVLRCLQQQLASAFPEAVPELDY